MDPTPLAAALALAMVLSVACADESPARPAALQPLGNPYATRILLRDSDDVFIYGVRRFRVVRPVTLRSFAPEVVPEGVDVLTARASFLRSVSGRRTANGYPGAFCTDTWPMAGFGPTYEIDGLTVAPGDEVAFTVYVRAARPGRYVLDGYDLKYEDQGERSLRTDEGQRAELRVLAPGEPPDRRPCDGSVRDIWMRP